MKKKLLIALGAIAIVMGGLTGMAYMQVSANDKALEEIKSDAGVIALDVTGMT